MKSQVIQGRVKDFGIIQGAGRRRPPFLWPVAGWPRELAGSRVDRLPACLRKP
jgi:hypothetical protein